MNEGRRRSAALLVPLSSVRTRAQAGIGEITDVPALAELARKAGFTAVQLLPLGEAVGWDVSPYASRSAYALDPIYVGLGALEDLPAAARDAARVDFKAVRAAKERALAAAFARFRETEWATGSRRAAELRRFAEEHAFWLDDYALFRALEDAHGGRSWLAWEAPLRERDPAALAAARADHEESVLYHRWLQWLADGQWREARRAANALGVRLAGDLPFMVATDSADVWARREDFRLDASVGAPPDALAPEGQDWGLPAYRWDALARADYRWLRERARRSAELYDLYRVDHVVGYYRTYVIPRDGGDRKTAALRGTFSPSEEPAQRAQGEAVLGAMRGHGAEIIAEDLGTIPPFVRRSLEALGIPGYRVLRWERYWDSPGRPFIDPRKWPACSVATSGTHDTTTLAVWWEREASPDDRRALREVIPGLEDAFTDATRRALLEALAASGSDLLILPIQDVLGTRDQINVPGTMTAQNWTYRLPFALEDAAADPRFEEFAEIARRNGR